MKKQTTFFVFSFVLFLSGYLNAQSTTFTVEAYKQFLSTHQNMDGGELMQLHDAGAFLNQTSAQTQTTLLNRSSALNFNMRAKGKLL